MALRWFLWLLSTSYFHANAIHGANYVRSSEDFSCVDQPCFTLNEYANKVDKYFVDNATFIFFSGLHQLNTSLYLESVSNVTFCASSVHQNNSVQLILSHSVVIRSVNCFRVEISGLVFHTNGETLYSALGFQWTTALLSRVTLFGNGTMNTIAISSSKIKMKDVMVVRAAGNYGAAIVAVKSTIEFLGHNVFVNNTANSEGGAIELRECIFSISGNTFFINNTANINGGALLLLDSVCNIYGNTSFVGNIASGKGGAIYCINTLLSFSGSALFQHNQANSGGGAIKLQHRCKLIFETKSVVSFTQNMARLVGGAISVGMSSLVIRGSALFERNYAGLTGGAISGEVYSRIYCSEKNISFQSGHTDSSHNEPSTTNGSEPAPVEEEKVLFKENGAKVSAGAIHFSGSHLYIAATKFVNNTAAYSSGAVNVVGPDDPTEVVFDGTNHFEWNRASITGAVQVFNGNINFRGRNYFVNNAADILGGALFARDSSVNMTGFLNFTQNSAQQGGAIAISGSYLLLNEPLNVKFLKNKATAFGGAFFVANPALKYLCSGPDTKREECFIELNSTPNIKLDFMYNTAGRAGTLFYGGHLDRCRLYVKGGVRDSCGKRIRGLVSPQPIRTIKAISTIISDDNITSEISSDPLQVCFCSNNHIECNDQHIETVRGKVFTLQVVTVGQNNGIVPSSVRTSLSNDIHISAKQRIQHTGKSCTPVKYRLFTESNFTTLILFPDGPCRDTGISRQKVKIKFLPCPDAFLLDGPQCVCEDRLQYFNTSCSVDNNSIERVSNVFWMGAVYENNTFTGLILHSGCPFDYCTDTPVSVKLDNLNIQCNHNRSGALCGSCNVNYSLAFCTLHCLPCSNIYLTLILPFGLAGIGLVAILLILKLSVTTGTMNGLIFYANVIQAHRLIFFPSGETNILTVFIAWLNLDLGFETCFYNGMDAYAFTWLQFVFPFYIWFLICLIIIMCRYSDKLSRCLGTNPIAVLATLFLLSYSKILSTVIIALSFTILKYPDDIPKLVWLYDANVPYFQRADHIVLGTFSITTLVILFLPYTILLLCGHWFQAYSHYGLFSWIHKIKPLMDAYHAPFRKEMRYWTGLLLIVRCALFLTVAWNVLGNTSVNLLAIISVTTGLASMAWVCNKVYSRVYNDILEASFILNLCILSATTFYLKETRGREYDTRVTYTSLGIVFATFICILVYHIYISLVDTSLWKKISSYYKKYWSKKIKNVGLDGDYYSDNQPNIIHDRTKSTVELRESLLEEVYN